MGRHLVDERCPYFASTGRVFDSEAQGLGSFEHARAYNDKLIVFHCNAKRDSSDRAPVDVRFPACFTLEVTVQPQVLGRGKLRPPFHCFACGPKSVTRTHKQITAAHNLWL